MENRSVIGDAPRRREDARFVTGRGAYLDDLRFDGLAHAVVLRSPHAHAWIHRHRCDGRAARAGRAGRPDGADADADGLQPLRPDVEANVQTGEPFAFAPQPLLAHGQGPPCRRTGRADRRRDARAGARCGRAGRVDYEPLPAVTTADAARAAGAPDISDEVPGQCLPRLAYRRCRRRRRRLRRGGACRIAAARQPPHRHQPDGAARRRRQLRRGEGRYTLHVSSQNIHINRDATRPRAGRPACGRALHRARCRRRLRRQELRLCRARADPVGGQAHRPAGEVDRHPQRSVLLRPSGARHQAEASLALDADGQVPGAQGRQRRQSRRLHGGRRRRRADLPVRPSAGHGVPRSPRSRCMSWRS